MLMSITFALFSVVVGELLELGMTKNGLQPPYEKLPMVEAVAHKQGNEAISSSIVLE